MNNFNRSQFMSNRHKESKAMFSYYKENIGTDVKYSDFLKRDTPLDDEIVSYEVSYQLTYSGESDEIKSTPYTFVVYGRRGQESDIESRTMKMIIDSRGVVTDENFNTGITEKLEKDSNTNIHATPRGMEQVTDRIERENIVNAITSGSQYHVRELDNTIKFKNKKGGEGEMKLKTEWFN